MSDSYQWGRKTKIEDCAASGTDLPQLKARLTLRLQALLFSLTRPQTGGGPMLPIIGDPFAMQP